MSAFVSPGFVLAALSCLAAPAFAQRTIDNGKTLYANKCEVCHGEYGEISNEVVPNILGQYPGYTLTQLQAFLSDDAKTARRGVSGSLKRSLLLDLSVQDIQDIVAYLNTIQYRIVGASKAEARGELEASGWWLANYAGCGNCHGDDFQGLRVRNPATGELDPGVGAPFTPKLVGLKYGYLMRQLHAYESGRRAGGLSGMKHVMAPLFQTPRMMRAIGSYAEGVHIVPIVDGDATAVEAAETPDRPELERVSTEASSKIPYVSRDGVEEVDYEKLNRIEGFRLPDSGQFRDATSVFGEDRDYTRHPMSFSTAKDGLVVIDNNTGLMWDRHLNWRWGKTVPPKGAWRPQDVFTYKDREVRRRPYHEGVQYCKDSRLAGYDDWRMPTVKEVHTIAHYASARPAIHAEYFKDTDAGIPGYGDRGKGGQWAGPLAPDHNNSAWHIGFIDGHFMGYPRGGYKTTRCVRADNNGAYFLPNFVDNGDGTVTDDVADLMWLQNGDGVLRDWEASIQYCETLEHAGYDDWKLPSNKELSSTVDLRKQRPAVDTRFFPDTDYKAYYWSRTPETRDASRNMMSETTVQPEDINIDNAQENAYFQEYMLGGNWRGPRRGLPGLARCVRYPPE